MNTTQIRPRVVFAVCCLAALPAVSLGSPQAGAQERAAFAAFYDRVTRAEAALFQGRPDSLMRRQGPAEAKR